MIFNESGGHKNLFHGFYGDLIAAKGSNCGIFSPEDADLLLIKCGDLLHKNLMD